MIEDYKECHVAVDENGVCTMVYEFEDGTTITKIYNDKK